MKYVVNGKVVTREEFMRGAKGIQDGPPRCRRPGQYPKASWAMGLSDAGQVKEAQEILAKNGVTCDFNKHYEPIFDSLRHQQSYMRALGYHNRNAGYGDPVPGDYAKDHGTDGES